MEFPTSVPVSCACGKRLLARAELAGKAIKCPSCGARITIPATEPAPTVAPTPVGPRPLSPDYRIRLGQWWATARPHLGAILGPSVGFFFVFAAITGGLFLVAVFTVAFLAAREFPTWSKFAALPVLLLCLLANLVLVPTLAIGFHVVAQAQLKGRPWSFGTFFTGFRWLPRLTGRAVLLGLVEGATTAPGLAVSLLGRVLWSEPPGVVVGLQVAVTLACALLGGYVFLRLVFFSHLLLIDRNCGVVESLRGSWVLSRGHFWGLCGIMLLVAGVGALSALTLGLALPLVLPVVVLVLNAGYLLVAGAEPLPGQPPEAERVPPRRASVLAWAPAAVAACLVLAVGAGVWFLTETERTRRREEMAVRQRKMEVTRKAEEEARKQREAQWEADAKLLVQFFKHGGTWSRVVYPELKDGAWDNRYVVVVGPPGLLKEKPEIRHDAAKPPPGADGTVAVKKLREVESSLGDSRLVFYRALADAVANGEVEAVLVTLKRPGGGPSGPGSGAGGQGGAGGPGDGGPPDLAPGAVVPLDHAEPLTRERFLDLIGGGDPALK